jgi:hypothetical protein
MAELRVVLLPVGRDASGAPGPAGAIAQYARPAGRAQARLRARFIVPSRNAGEMLWAATVLGTLAITVPSGVSCAMIMLILALELTGLVAAALSARRRPPQCPRCTRRLSIPGGAGATSARGRSPGAGALPPRRGKRRRPGRR